MEQLNVLDLFAGIGGASYAGKLIGNWRTVCYVEFDPYCQRVIQARIKDGIFEDAPMWDDVRTFDGKPWRRHVDIITAGFPCQPFSVAGKQRGESDERNMWPDTLRIIREVRPRFAFLENVPALISSGYFGRILCDLTQIGYDCRWTIVSAADVGAPHLRKRLWILAYSNCERRGKKQKPWEECEDKTIVRNDGATQSVGYPHQQRELQQEGTITESGRRPGNTGEAPNTDNNESGSIWWQIDPADVSNTDCSGLRERWGSESVFQEYCSTERNGETISNSISVDDDGSGYGTGEICGERSEKTELPESGKGEFVPLLGRVVNRCTNRVNRLKGLGNAWVPAQAVEAWLRLTDGLI